MLSFKEFIAEATSKPVVHPFPDRISQAVPTEDRQRVRNLVAGIGQGVRSYNKYILLRHDMPALSHKDSHFKRTTEALDTIFNRDHNMSIEGPATLYNATRHEVEFDDKGRTMIRGIVHTSPILNSVMTQLNKNHPGEDTSKLKAHHILEIQHEGAHSNVPAVYIGHHSTRSSEREALLPPLTEFEHVATREHGVNERTGKPILIHTVKPVTTYPQYDRAYPTETEDQHLERWQRIGNKDRIQKILEKRAKAERKASKKK